MIGTNNGQEKGDMKNVRTFRDFPTEKGLWTRETKQFLSNNNISEKIPQMVLHKTRQYLDHSFNYMEGTLPIPPNTIKYYLLSNNKLSKVIPSSTFVRENIQVLDLTDNYSSGVLPSCFRNFNFTLHALSLSGNNLIWRIPKLNHEQCGLRTMDQSSNSFERPLPRLITNCQMLAYVNFGRNKIMNAFSSWLGSLASLKVLMLLSNRFHGEMKEPVNEPCIPSMKIIK